MKICLSIIFLFIQSSFFKKANAQNRPLEISIKLQNALVEKREDLLLELNLCNKFNNIFLIPKYLNFWYANGYGLRNNEEANVLIELQEINKGKYIKQKSEIIDQTVPYELFFDDGNFYDTLCLNKCIQHSCQIASFFPLGKKGEYRIRVKFIIAKDNRIKQKYMYSDWLVFRINSLLYKDLFK